MKQLMPIGGMLSMAALLGCIGGEYSETSRAEVASSAANANLDSLLARLPAADREVMLAQVPLKEAALQIRDAVEAGDDDGYAGIELDHGRVVLWWRGAMSDSLAAVVEKARRIAPVDVNQAPHTHREILAAAGQLGDYIRANPDSGYVSVSYPVDGTGVFV